MASNDALESGSMGAKILQPYIDAASTCQNATAMRAVVSKVLQDPELFAGYDQIKSALLQAGSSSTKRELTPSEESIIRTLDLFSYGTLTDYHKQASGYYMTLTDAQLFKLRQLTVLTLIEQACMKKQDRVTYDAIYQELHLAGTAAPRTAWNEQASLQDRLLQGREIEFLLAQLLGARLVAGKLSQKNSAFLLNKPSLRDGNSWVVQPRDVHPSTIENFMLPALSLLNKKLVESSERIQAQQAHLLQTMEQEKEALQRQADKMQIDSIPSLEGGSGAHGQRPKRSRGGLVGSTGSSNDARSNAAAGMLHHEGGYHANPGGRW
jgi:hypothetical protein